MVDQSTSASLAGPVIELGNVMLENVDSPMDKIKIFVMVFFL